MTIRVLLVEDDTAMLDVTAKVLRHSGHEVIVASGMTDALEAAERQKCDVLVTDLRLSDGNGVALARELQSRHDLPAIALSGAAPDEYEGAATLFATYLLKPVSVEALVTAIREACR